MRDHMRVLRSYQEYNFFEGSADKGGGVREKAKQLIDLLSNNESIRDEREKARKLRDKFVGIGSGGGGGGGGGGYRGFGNDSGSYSGGGGGGSHSGSGSDRYSGSGSGSSGRYNSRYGNDSAPSSSGRDRYSDSGSSGGYSSGGIGSGGSGGSSYSSGGIGSERSSSSKGRYGGGAYDSGARARYSDDAPDSLDSRSTVAASRSGSADTNDHRREPIERQGSGGAQSSSSKIKVTIKDKAGGSSRSQPVQHQAPPQQEVDLFNDPTVGHSSSSDQFGDFAGKITFLC